MRQIFISLLCFGLGTILFLNHTFAQSGSDKPSLLVGFYGGINFSKPKVLQSFQVIESMDGTGDVTSKEYEGYASNLGNQFGFVLFYPFKNLHIGLLPGFSSYSYNYTSTNSWVDGADAAITIEQTYKHKQKIRYLEIPLVVRYYIGTANLKPYVQALGSYGILHSADKTVDANLVRNQDGTELPISSSSNAASYNSSFINSKISVGAGLGIAYDLNQLILTLDVSMMQNLNIITNENSRYSNANFTGSSYDIQDDLKLNNILINLSLIFPINKITKRGAVECNYFRTN